MTSLDAEFGVTTPRLEGSGLDGSPEGSRFLQPAAGRVIAGAGLAGAQLRQVLRHHSSIARRIVLGRQILKIVGKRSKPL